MAFIPAANCAKAVLRLEQFGRIYTNSLWFLKSGGWNSTTLLGLATNVVDYWADYVAPVTSDQVTAVGCVAYDMTTLDGPASTYNPGIPPDGDLTDATLPGNVTAAISFRTANRGRSGRGRIYHVGLTEPMVVDNTLTGAWPGDLQEAWSLAIAEVEGLSVCTHVVVSFQIDGAPRAFGYAQPVTSITVDNKVDTQRRRVR